MLAVKICSPVKLLSYTLIDQCLTEWLFLSTVDECRQLFAHVITTDAACRGFDPVSNGIVFAVLFC